MERLDDPADENERGMDGGVAVELDYVERMERDLSRAQTQGSLSSVNGIRLRLALVVIVLAVPLFAREIEIPPPGQRWLILERDGFTFISNAPAAQTLQVAYGFTGLRHAILEVVGPSRLLRPTKIFIFANARSFAPYRDALLPEESKDSGIAIRRDAGTFMVLQADDPAGISPFMLHTLAHELIDSRHPSLPLWFREGLAEYFSSYRVIARQPQLGKSIPRHVMTLKREKWLPAPELFSLDSHWPQYDERTRDGIFYAQSWLFAHTLLKGSDARRARIAKFIALADAGEPETAFNRAFDLTPQDLASEAESHLKQLGSPIRIQSLKPEMAKLDELPAPRAIERDELLFELAALLATSEANEAIAQRFVTEALKINPAQARANALRGRLLENSHQHEAAVQASEKALHDGGDDEEVLLLCAEGVVQRLARGQNVDAGEVRQARALFEKAARLDADSPRAWMGLGATYITTPDDPAPGIKAMENARRLDPMNESIPLLLANLLARDPERVDEAKALAEESLRQTASPEIHLHLEQLLIELDEIGDEDNVLHAIKTAQEEVNADHLMAALQIIDEVLPRIEDPDLLAETRRWRAEIEKRLREKQ